MSDNTEQERAVVEAIAKAGDMFHSTAEWFIERARKAGYVLVERALVEAAAKAQVESESTAFVWEEFTDRFRESHRKRMSVVLRFLHDSRGWRDPAEVREADCRWLAMHREARAERDALAERCREYKCEWESACERANSSEHLRKEVEARAARLAAAQAKVSEAINQWSIAIVHLIVAAPTVELRTVLKDLADTMIKARAILAADTAEKEKA